eukprot:1133684-Prymnesium_polylepis.1
MQDPFLCGQPSHHFLPPPPVTPANAEPPGASSDSVSPSTPTQVENNSSACPPSASTEMKVGCG